MSDDAILELELEDSYIGSTYSPQVEVTAIEGGHAVAITYDDADSGITTETFEVMDGEQGPQGIQGPQGPQGERGPQGEKGDTGATGAQGPKGDKGDTGAQGPQGEKGATGATGATGAQGPQGPTGATGATGAAAGFGTPTASVDSATGTPSVSISASGPDTEKVFNFAFHNLKGEQGIPGDTQADGAYPAFVAGGADSLLGNTPTDETFISHAVPSGVSSGMARIECVKGNTIRWNQLNNNSGIDNTTGLTRTFNANGSVTINGTSTQSGAINLTTIKRESGHKYLVKGCPSGGSSTTYYLGLVGNATDTGNGGIYTSNQTGNANFRMDVKEAGITFNNVTFWPLLFDLTAMFGAGNEPATVAEFEALYSEDYYAYDAGNLLSVNIEGIKTVGFNQCNFAIPYASSLPTTLDKQKAVELLGGNHYYWGFESFTGATSWRFSFVVFDDDGNKITSESMTNMTNLEYRMNTGSYLSPHDLTEKHCEFTPTRNVWIMPLFSNGNTSASSVMNNPCINISDPTRNGTYEPYETHTREIPVSTYFPNGLRGAGTAHDALYHDHFDTVMAAVDLGTLDWAITSGVPYFSADIATFARKPENFATVANIICAAYETKYADAAYASVKCIALTPSGNIVIYDGAYETPAALKTALSGVYLYYELATPTTTQIDPPLNLTYQVESGGTESVIVPTGEMTAPVPMAICYGYTAEGLRDESMSIVAPIENFKASTNYAIGSYLVHLGKLYKVTTAIATGETITPGTNCVQTTVMAELVALTA